MEATVSKKEMQTRKTVGHKVIPGATTAPMLNQTFLPILKKTL
jgi:hypothetical protein